MNKLIKCAWNLSLLKEIDFEMKIQPEGAWDRIAHRHPNAIVEDRREERHIDSNLWARGENGEMISIYRG